jgi:thioredoxin reductase (NADPH)
LAEFAQQVVVVDRGSALPAQAAYRERVNREPKIRVLLETVVEEVVGDLRVAGLRLRELATGTESILEISGLFVLVGGVANDHFLDGLAVTDEHGQVITDASMRTALPGLFAAGSIRSGFTGQAVSAAGDGAAAAVVAHRYLDAHRAPAADVPQPIAE